MDGPQELEADDGVEIVERVAAIDVAKATGMVCTRVPRPAGPGRRLTKVWEVKATTKGITDYWNWLSRRRAGGAGRVGVDLGLLAPVLLRP
ncbi:hypothetical protein K6U06_24050 [Acidiferrimicrobium sp. IK]|uniref:hypothetical protein n=1 Tax=Acidiferrimicrobium sp. IK TaxID=2871700 RepID=UPI0021CAE98F|nr:hypothetical protein [Acidiferrimicrobium sp. IK]MCU4187452.1 hypothetical protein [Acidiferrimicrobium sp. IK]